MFCPNCGKELNEEWLVCPNCGTEISDANGEEEADLKVWKKLLKVLVQEHPVRVTLCIPVILLILYMLWGVFTMDMGDINLWMLINAAAFITFCDTALWLLYGPVNLKEVEEKVWKKPKKGLGIASHLGSVVLMAVILTVGNFIMDESNYDEETTSNLLSVDGTASEEPGSDMSIEEYINQCQEVTGEELARNPEQYIGKDIIMEGDFNILGGNLVMNWFTDSGIIRINYDGNAVDTQGNVVGNVITGDSGCVAGRYGGKDEAGRQYIDAAIVILDKE